MCLGLSHGRVILWSLLSIMVLGVILVPLYSIDVRADWLFPANWTRDGSEEKKPEEGQTKKATLFIDAVYHEYVGTEYNAFSQGSCKSSARYHFSGTNVTLNFEVPAKYVDNLNPSYSDDEVSGLWQQAHLRFGADYAFVFSCKELDGSSYGRTINGPVYPGISMDFTSEHITFLDYSGMNVYAMVNTSIWGYTLTHELGHLYAGLLHVADNPNNHDSRYCVMHTLAAQSSDERKKELLAEYLFCPLCKGFIKGAIL